MHRLLGIIMLALLCALVCGGAMAGEYNLDWGVVAGGGDSGTSASYRLTVTAGQPAAGFAQGTSQLHWIGFLTGEMSMPTVAPSILAAKFMPDGTFVSLAGRIATSGIGDFPAFFYVEELDRINGIRIAAPPSAVSGLARGSVVNVIGTLGTTPNDERQLTGPIVIIASTAEPLAPLSMSNAWLGGGDIPRDPPIGQYGVWRWQTRREDNKWVRKWLPSPDLNNIGLLIQTWGKVTAVGAGYVEIDDGEGPVRVDTATLASQPALDSYVSVIGISSIHKTETDRRRLVLPRGDLDVILR